MLNRSKMAVAFSLCVAILTTPSATVEAGLFGKCKAKRRAAYSSCSSVTMTTTTACQAAPAVASPACTPQSFPTPQALPTPATPDKRPPSPTTGQATTTTTYEAYFITWLNGHRARHGIGPVAYNPALSYDAQMSNHAMRQRRFGHHWDVAPYNKNVGMGDPGTIMMLWASSPAHNAWLLRASEVGVAFDGSYGTFSAR